MWRDLLLKSSGDPKELQVLMAPFQADLPMAAWPEATRCFNSYWTQQKQVTVHQFLQAKPVLEALLQNYQSVDQKAWMQIFVHCKKVVRPADALPYGGSFWCKALAALCKICHTSNECTEVFKCLAEWFVSCVLKTHLAAVPDVKPMLTMWMREGLGEVRKQLAEVKGRSALEAPERVYESLLHLVTLTMAALPPATLAEPIRSGSGSGSGTPDPASVLNGVSLCWPLKLVEVVLLSRLPHSSGADQLEDGIVEDALSLALSSSAAVSCTQLAKFWSHPYPLKKLPAMMQARVLTRMLVASLCKATDAVFVAVLLNEGIKLIFSIESASEAETKAVVSEFFSAWSGLFKRCAKVSGGPGCLFLRCN
jgi:hypothetical protein